MVNSNVSRMFNRFGGIAAQRSEISIFYPFLPTAVSFEAFAVGVSLVLGCRLV